MGAGLFLLVWEWEWVWCGDCVMHARRSYSSRLHQDFPNSIANTPVRPLILLAKMLGLYHNSELWRRTARTSPYSPEAQAQPRRPILRASWIPTSSKDREKKRAKIKSIANTT
ncbi:hypothetical protein LZ31DRAFT_549040 [Colletotrichum somersetense]|nr:hypothetical protein LZ31DRAFT_549040 [Colletotrichum somersetense]